MLLDFLAQEKTIMHERSCARLSWLVTPGFSAASPGACCGCGAGRRAECHGARNGPRGTHRALIAKGTPPRPSDEACALATGNAGAGHQDEELADSGGRRAVHVEPRPSR
jgi:hypothetical protein